jgi:hypothetical protein
MGELHHPGRQPTLAALPHRAAAPIALVAGQVETLRAAQTLLLGASDQPPDVLRGQHGQPLPSDDWGDVQPDDVAIADVVKVRVTWRRPALRWSGQPPLLFCRGAAVAHLFSS